ncbi:hypothetical protein LIT38_10315 [Bacillus sp. CMF12]|uniref:hypothetical protein n=1 Tax=Bacillaceae TaxID=186817 RepID=UPI001FB47AB2|nr:MULTISPECIES: hypothetical protein [Bacillaceae]UOE57345.1 hypothetical protein IRB79_11620 [Cytobacillus oceanisediminis]USK51804.1 hypothetical protein LIT38_10315 [Bacillus sp. CMF12]
MNKINYFIAFIGIISIFIVGCSNVKEDEELNIEVQKCIGDENKYDSFKVITNSEQVKKVREILNSIDWENAKVDMANSADYRFAFQYKNPEIEAKAVLYELWISPNKDKVELVIDAESKYVQLDKNKSAELFEILTGGKLSDLY